MDWAPILALMIDCAAAAGSAVAVALLTYATMWLRSKTNLVTEEHAAMARSYVEAAIAKGVEYAKVQAAKVDTKIGSTGNEIVDVAAKYVIAAVPEGLAKLGISPEQVKKLVEARMADMLKA